MNSEQVAFKGYDSKAVANFFVGLAFNANRMLTILPLVKFVYLAHGWTLGYTGKPLIRDPIEAWRLGPVIPEVYYTFRPQGIVIRDYARNSLDKPYEVEKYEDAEESIMTAVFNRYSVKDYSVLSGITHLPGTPWSQSINTRDRIIDDKKIKKYYDKIIKDKQK